VRHALLGHAAGERGTRASGAVIRVNSASVGASDAHRERLLTCVTSSAQNSMACERHTSSGTEGIRKLAGWRQ
jgi:hypothetical protein